MVQLFMETYFTRTKCHLSQWYLGPSTGERALP